MQGYENRSMFGQMKKFLQEVGDELGRVEWPKKDEFIGATLVTLVLVLFFTIYLGFIDVGVGLIIRRIFGQI